MVISSSTQRGYTLPLLNEGFRHRPLVAALRAVLASGLMCEGVHAAGEALPVPDAILASKGAANYATSGLTGTVNQTSDKAVLNWKSFNIGPQNTLQFVQPSASAIALNRINERVNPSQILGTLTANGQVYLYNPNGFVFGKDARVNVNALVATTLDVSDQVFERGITKVFDQNQGQAAFQWTGAILGDDGRPVQVATPPTGSQITIEQGARIGTNAPNRRILIVAPVIDNRGDLKAQDGEIILAGAQDKLYLQEAPADSSYPGLLVEVNKGGLVNNDGTITAPRGAITLMGFAVNQNHRVTATTSVLRNGTIRLLAREGAQVTRDDQRYVLNPGSTHRTNPGDDGLGQNARVTLGRGSVTEVQPEYGDPTTAVDEQPQPRSRIEIMGKQVRLDADAQVLAPSGDVSVSGVDPTAGTNAARVRDTRIDLAPGSRIDVAGLKDVNVAMERNVVAVELRGNELRDAPLQRHGVLRNQKVYVDVRKGTKVADVSAAIRRVGRTIEERSTSGGHIALDAPGAVVVNDGASLDVSGGSVQYRDGYIKTTQLLQQGRVVDIGDADPSVIYDGILSPVTQYFEKWNQTLTWTPRLLAKGRFEQGYLEGKDGGSLDIRTEALHLMGQIQALTRAGVHQRSVDTLPKAASLSIDLTATTLAGQDVRFQPGTSARTILDPNSPFPGLANGAETPAPLILSADFQKATGARKLSIKTSGHVDVVSGSRLDVPGAGALSLTGGKVVVSGIIDAPGGWVDFATEITDKTQGLLDGSITLKSGSRIDVGGVWLNDKITPNGSALLNLDGGAITLKSHGDIVVERGSELAADGGAWLRNDGEVEAGKGGSITLEAKAYPNQLGANLTLDGTVHAYALQHGGSLSLTANEIVISDGAESAVRNGTLQPLVLDSTFFSQGGFGHYTVASNLNGVTVGSDAHLRLKAQNFLLSGNYTARDDARSLRNVATLTTLPDPLREPVDLTLAHRPPGQDRPLSGIVVKQGARIDADPKAHLALLSERNIEVNGTLSAPGGNIDLKVLTPADVKNAPTFLPGQGIFLGGGARLDASGTSILHPDPLGFRTGELLAGGAVDMRAERGYIVAAQGSSIDVSGASDRYQLAASPNYRLIHGFDDALTRFDSNGGSIRFLAAEGVLLDGELRGGAGGPMATGGSLHVELNTLFRNESGGGDTGSGFPGGPRVLEMHASTGSHAPFGWAPGQDIPMALNGLARFSSTRVREGEFAALTLKSNDEIVLRDSLALSLSRRLVLDAPVLRWTANAGTAQLSADYVAIGSSLNRDASKPASTGTGILEVSGRLIDLVGAVSLQGYSASRLTSTGDIRLRGVAPSISELGYRGEFKTAGALTLEAQQIYPTTASAYRIDLTGANTTLRIEGLGGSAAPVLSAGGNLTLRAPHIVQAGTLEAPFGTIDFIASDSIHFDSGSLTSVSGKGLLVPFGRTPGGIDWLYPMVGINGFGDLLIGDINLVFSGPPDKAVRLNAPDIALAPSASIDIAGGGDLHAFEFAAGLGGSLDVLDPRDPKVLRGEVVYEPKFAVLPSFKAGFAPYDPLEFPVSGLNMGDSIYLSGIEGLPAGEYALLPAHYALLPGAFLVTPKSGYTDIQPGQNFAQTDGAQVIAGFVKQAGTSEMPVTWSAFAVEPGSAARTRSEYQEHKASNFFEKKAQREGLAKPASVFDAGSLSLAATRNLELGASILATPSDGGRGGQLDVVAQNIAVMTHQAAGGPLPDGVIALIDDDLNRLGVESLGLGTSRSRNRDGSTQLHVAAEQVVVHGGVHLEGQEILLAAKEHVTVADGAEVAGEGPFIAKLPEYRIEGDAALLRVSSGAQAGYQHDGEAGTTGDLHIQAGAVVRAQGSMLLDASRDTRLSGELSLVGGDLAIHAGVLHLGQTPGGASGAVLSDELLAGLDVDNLVLSSRGAINFHGTVDLALRNVVFDAAELAGFGGLGDRVSIHAQSLRLAHGSDTPLVASGTGFGSLELDVDRFEFGTGNYAISGFSAMDLTGRNDVTFSGQATVDLKVDTRVSTAGVGGSDGARLTIDASGHYVTFEGSDGTSSAKSGLGSRFDVVADAIEFGTRLIVPSGVASFTALQGDVDVVPGAQLDLAGRRFLFPGQTEVQTPGGWLTLTSRSGDVNFTQGVEVKLAAGGDRTDAGTLELHAGGATQLDATLDAGSGGRLIVDASSLGTGGFSALNAKANAGGFDRLLDIRQRQGDLMVNATDTVFAHSIDLSADAGHVRVEGILDASGAEGGDIRLSAGEQVVLEAGAKLRAVGDSGAGGRVELASAKTIGAVSEQQGLQLRAGSSIDLSGTSGGGELHLRALRDGQNVSIAPIEAHLHDVESAIVEAVKVENVSDFSQIAAWKAQMDAFMTHAQAISQAIGGDVTVRPGLELRSTGDLLLNQTWNLNDWRYTVDGNVVPGYLTVRAGGDVRIDGSISDGFDAANALQTGESWTLRIAAGADRGVDPNSAPIWSADWRRTVNGTGNVTLGSGALLRTGTGDIEIRSGGDLILQHQTSAIYTAGRADSANRYGNLSELFRDAFFQVEYPVDGGNVTIVAGGDIQGAKSDQLISDWLLRMGNFDSKVSAAERELGDVFFGIVSEEELPTAWGIRFDFQQNVGALGGGDVLVSAGGTLRNLQIMLPTTGKQVGEKNSNLPISDFTLLDRYITNEVEINGGGNLSVSARGDILGGQFWVDRGGADIVSFGSITGGTPQEIQFESGPLFAIGDAEFRVRSGGDLQVGAAYNPFAFNQRVASRVYNAPSSFFGYTERSALKLDATSGNIDFRIDVADLSSEYIDVGLGGSVLADRSAQAGVKLLPGTVEAMAARGSITLNSFDLFPSPTGNLLLAAGGDIASDPEPVEIIVNLSDADPALFPSAQRPASDLANVEPLLDVRTPGANLIHATQPVHRNDPAMAKLISQGGSIDGHNNLKLFLSKPTRIAAGVDIKNVGLNLQNLRVEDFSIIDAGRDLRYTIGRGTLGELEQLQGFGVQVAGPGQLHVLTGRDMDLGASDGIVTTGDLVNPALDDVGASVTVMAGLTQPPAYADFLDAYFGPGGSYHLIHADPQHPETRRYHMILGPAGGTGLDPGALGLSQEEQRELSLLVFFNELKESSQEAAAGDGYSRGAEAIAKLFPAEDYAGDIKLFFSRIHTLAGGNIDLLAPGGLINAGLASAFVGEKKPDELGVVTQRGGAVRTYSEGDLQVNQSRVFALSGDALDFTQMISLVDAQGRLAESYKDVIAWSALGNIDAGRGGKSLSVSTGKKGFDQDGNWTDEVPPTISGSGVRAGGDNPGGVFLAAPQGVVDAGEAGIAGNTVTIAANAIIGASNIQTSSGGFSSNVTTTPSAPPVAPAGAASAAASATKSAQTLSSDTSATPQGNDQAHRKEESVGMLSVDLVGFGDCSVSDVREGKAGCGGAG